MTSKISNKSSSEQSHFTIEEWINKINVGWNINDLSQLKNFFDSFGSGPLKMSQKYFDDIDPIVKIIAKRLQDDTPEKRELYLLQLVRILYLNYCFRPVIDMINDTIDGVKLTLRLKEVLHEEIIADSNQEMESETHQLLIDEIKYNGGNIALPKPNPKFQILRHTYRG